MNHRNRLLAVLSLAWLAGQCAAQDALPQYLAVELKRLQETWHLLDAYADSVWPGWKDYRETPFLIAYPNGVRLLVGHPDPPKGFTPSGGMTAEGKSVFLDRTGEIALPVKPPLLGGGGPIPVGVWKGKPVSTVSLRLSYADPELARREDSLGRTRGEPAGRPAALRCASENQILLNVHELFHCYQEKVYRPRHGNLRYNTDANYAVYSEIEGLALERAFLAARDDSVKIFLSDFLAARELKRRSMTEEQQSQESEEDLREGTAVYAEAMLLRVIARGYTPGITPADDPFYGGFREADAYVDSKLRDLRAIRGVTLESREKVYTYGCFQALALNRISPGWQKGFFESGTLLDQLIARVLARSSGTPPAAEASLKRDYGYDTLFARHSAIAAGRDRALALVEGRKGRAYVVNFKETGEYLSPKPRGEVYRVGLMTIFPRGIDSLRVQEVVLRGEETPILQDQLYYVKWVDDGAGGYTVQCSRREEKGVYYNAIFRTGGFTLSAPKLQVTDTPGRVKVTILSKVKVE